MCAKKNMQGVPAQNNVQGVPTQNNVQGVPTQSKAQGVPTQKKVKGVPTRTKTFIDTQFGRKKIDIIKRERLLKDSVKNNQSNIL